MNCKLEKIKEKIETEINTSLLKDFLCSDTFFSGKTVEADFSELLQTVQYTIASGGKRWRAILTVLCFQAFGCTETEKAKSIYKLASVIEFIHTASLIHDDIEDSSELRRGQAAAHIKFGLDTALNSGAWLYFHALRLLQSLDLSDKEQYFISEIVSQGIYNLHLGQALDISWHRDENFFPSQEQYEKMIRLKTGTLAGLSAAIGVYLANANEDTSFLASNAMQELGIAFQIIDDIKNITTGIIGKDKADDIVEGKKSLPLILFVANEPEKKEELSAYLKQAKIEGINSKAVKNAIDLLNKSDCIIRAKNYAHKKIKLSKKFIQDIFPPGKERDELLDFLDSLV